MPLEPEDFRSKSVLTVFLCDLTAACARNAWLTIILIVASVVGCVYYTYQKMEFKTDRSDLIDPKAKFQQRWQEYTKEFGISDDVVVVVEGKNAETIQKVMEEIGGRLAKRSELFSDVFYKIETESLRKKGLQYLSPELLEKGLEGLKVFRPVVEGNWDFISLNNTVERLHNQLKQNRDQAEVLNQADILFTSLLNTIRDREQFTNPWPEFIQAPHEMRDRDTSVVYVLNDDGTMGFVTATVKADSSSFEGPTAAIDEVRKAIADARKRNPSVRLMLTGISVLENDEMRRSMADSTMSSIISFAGVAILMFLGFGGFVHPFMGVFMLAVGTAWAFGYTTLTIGHLNILSVSFAAMLIGLGDFAMHVLSKYLELRHHGQKLHDALVNTTESVGVGIVTGALTISLAFFCATMTDFLGVAELGIIAGGGIMLCALAAFTILPATIAVSDHETEVGALPKPFQARMLRGLTLQHPWLVLIVSLGVIGFSAFQMFDWSGPVPKIKVTYDHNLLNLQAKGLESVDAQEHIFESSQRSLLYAIAIADSPEEAVELKQKFQQLDSVHQVQELATRLPQAIVHGDNIQLVRDYHALLSNLPSEPPVPGPVNPTTVGETVERFYLSLKGRTDSQSKSVRSTIDSFLSDLEALSLKDQLTFLGEFQYRMSYALLAQMQAIAAVSNPEPVAVADLPRGLRARFVSPSGKWLLQIYPREQIWDMEPLEQFVNDVRSVDPDATGTPLQNYEASRQIKSSYEICALYALGVVLITLILDFAQKKNLFVIFVPAITIAVVLLMMMQAGQLTYNPGLILLAFTMAVVLSAIAVDMRAVGDSILALMPPIVGLGMTFGILVIFDIPLNPANLIILPLILGIGVENGVHILHDFHSKPTHVFVTSASTINAIMLTSTTTMVGFGSMMVSAHRGLYSLGQVLTIGVGTCTFVSLVTLPAILTIFSRHRGLHHPITESHVDTSEPVVTEPSSAESSSSVPAPKGLEPPSDSVVVHEPTHIA